MGDLVRTGIIRPDEVGRVGGEVETDLLSSNWSVSQLTLLCSVSVLL